MVWYNLVSVLFSCLKYNINFHIVLFFLSNLAFNMNINKNFFYFSKLDFICSQILFAIINFFNDLLKHYLHFFLKNCYKKNLLIYYGLK